MDLTFHADPGHAWLEVPIDTLKEVDPELQYSHYSYRNGANAYLEEDCDAPRFLRLANKHGIIVSITERYTDGEHHIRNFAPLDTTRL